MFFETIQDGKSILANTVETIHLTLSLTVAPCPLQRGCHGLQVSSKSTGKAVELGHAAPFGGDEPWPQRLVVTSANELAELQRKLLDTLNRWPGRPELFREEAFVGLQAGSGTQKQPGGLTR